MLCHGGENVNGELVRIRHIDRLELDATFHQVRNEGDVTGKTIQFGND
jgi:hypothetical protein